jgi:hypothetical protein
MFLFLQRLCQYTAELTADLLGKFMLEEVTAVTVAIAHASIGQRRFQGRVLVTLLRHLLLKSHELLAILEAVSHYCFNF